MDHFLSQHVVDICLLSETFLNPGQAFRFANYACHRTDRLTAGDGRAILVRRGTVHHSVPVPGLTHLQPIVIQVTLAGRPVKNIAAFVSPSRLQIGADLTFCFGGGFPVLMDGDLSAKHVDWNSRLNTITKRLMRVPTSSPPGHPAGIALLYSEKPEALTDNLEAQFQPVTGPSVPAVIEMVDVTLRTYFLTPASEPKLTIPEKVREAIRGLKASKAPCPNGIPSRVLKHLQQRAISLLVQIFNAILLTQQFPTAWKHARVISILKPGKDPTLPSFYRTISLLDTIGNLFEKILLARILHEVSDSGLMRDEQFEFRLRHSTSLQLARLFERIIRNFGEKRLTGAVFLDVAKAFDIVWIDGLLYRLTLLSRLT